MARAAAREVNTIAPRIVADGIRLERAKAFPGQELVLTYSLISMRVAEIEAELWEQQVRPLIVHNVRRAQEQEARGLLAAEITVNYRYVDSAGQLIVEIEVAPRSLPCNSGEPSGH